ncbi:MAG TPA: hypothetical protein VGN52_14295 [Burkholderiales bacterium]|jgi:hypothetical protein
MKEKAAKEVNWIASRTYLVRKKGQSRFREIFVGLTKPRKLRKNEMAVSSSTYKFGCFVQTGKPFTSHAVAGRDELEALCHSILAIENFLITIGKDSDIRNPDGSEFDLSQNGLLFGPIGAIYLEEHLKITNNREQ